MDEYQIRSKTVAITTDGASNFKCALKRHGDDYESFEQLMDSIDDCDEELFHLDFDDLANMWCPASELVEGDDIMPIEIPNSDDSEGDADNDADVDADENFRIHPVPNEILQQVIADLNENSAVTLPSRIDCCAHAFNSIGRTDSFQALKNDEQYALRYISVFRKLNAIWKVNSTRAGREVFDRCLKGYKILKPHRIRWNRMFDAVS